MGARVIAVSNDSGRAELALGLGAREAYISGRFEGGSVFGGEGADIVVLTANAWTAYRESLEMARRGGRISMLGFPGRAQPFPDFNPLDMRWIYGKQLTLTGAGHLPRVNCAASDLRFNLQRNIAFILDRMAAKELDLGSIISHRFPYSRMQEAYDLARQHAKELSAAVFHWG